MTNASDTPPWEPIGDANADDIYRAVGKALSSWELIEEALARLFALFTYTIHQYPQEAPAIRAYGSVISFAGRAEMVRVAGLCFFKGYADRLPFPRDGEFGSLIGECTGWSGRRNDVAHGRVGQTLMGYYLFPGLFNTKKHPLGQVAAYAYTATQIVSFAAEFESLYDRLSEYATEVDGWLHTWIENILARENQPSTSLDP